VNAKQELGEALNQIFELTNENKVMEREAIAAASHRSNPADNAIMFHEEEYKTPQPAASEKFSKAF
jgi:hypothetical protein